MDKVNSLEFAHEYYFCRKLTGVPVAVEKLGRILEAACITPTAHSEQPFRVFLLEGPEVVEKVHGIAPCILEADCSLMMAAVPGGAWVCEFDQANFATVGASIVATHIVLAVKVEELDTTQVGHFDASCTRELSPATTPHELIAFLPIGEKAAETHPAHLHEKRKPITGLVERP